MAKQLVKKYLDAVEFQMLLLRWCDCVWGERRVNLSLREKPVAN